MKLHVMVITSRGRQISSWHYEVHVDVADTRSYGGEL